MTISGAWMKQDIAILVDYDTGKTGVPFWLNDWSTFDV
jgi:hypothetical protein